MLEDLARYKPTIMASVPKVWERAYDGFMTKLANKGFLERTIAQYAVKKSVESIKQPTLWRNLWNKVAQRVVFPKLHEALGGNLRLVVSGGGALPAHVDYFFHAAGLGVEFEILEGYGMTETAPLIAVRTPGEGELQSVGTLIDGIEAKLLDPDTGKEVEEGVLHVRGPNVMLGYYKDDEETQAVLNDGWMNTGDICYFDPDNCLHITGRAKEMIVLSNGENVPQSRSRVR